MSLDTWAKQESIVAEFDAVKLVAETFEIDVNGGEVGHEKHH